MSSQETKTVNGYPAQQSQVAVGYPAPSAYSYAAPPPPYPPVTPTPHSRRFCGPRLILLSIFIFSLACFLFFITWLVLRPRLPEFRVDSALLSPVTPNRSDLSASCNFTFFVRNPNHKLGIFYDKIQASVYYSEIELSAIQLPPFYQEKRNETTVRAGFSVMGEYVGEEVVKGILSERDRGTVRFGVKLFAWIRFRSEWWRTREHLLKVYCDGLRIGYLENNGSGRLLGQSKACDVKL